MRVAIVAALLVLSMGVVAAPVDAKPDSYCELADDRTGVHCHVELYRSCYWDVYVTVEDVFGFGGYCH